MLLSQLEPIVPKADDVFDHIVEALRTKTPLVYSKINHGFWERLVALEAEGFEIEETDPGLTSKMDQLKTFRRATPYMFEGGFVRELLTIFTQMPESSSKYVFSAGLLGWPGRLEIAGISHDEGHCQNMIARCVPEGVRHKTADGMEFKRAIINGSYSRFVAAIRQQKALLVGNRDLSRYFEFIGHEQGEHLLIHESKARENRVNLLEEIEKRLISDPSLKLILLQAGGSLSAWLIHHIHRKRPDVTLIDIGLGSLICHPEKLFSTPFGRIYSKQLQDTIEAIHPEWLLKIEDQATVQTVKTGRSAEIVEVLHAHGIERPTHFFDPETPVRTPIEFEYCEPSDVLRLEQIQGTKADIHHITCDVLKQTFSLPQEDEIILCRTEQEAATLAAAILSNSCEAVLNWRMNALSLAGSTLSPTKVDCDEQGALKKTILSECHPSGPGLIHYHDSASISFWVRLREHCRTSNTPLIVMNSMHFSDRPATPRPRNEIEILSCDNTQFWGAGEASAVILSSNLALLAGNVISDADPLSKQTSSKFLDRLERHERLAFFFKRQARRLDQLIQRNIPNLTAWPANRKLTSPVGHLTYISETPLSEENFVNKYFEIRKTFSNVSKDFPIAVYLSGRLLSIPCHPMMRHVSNHDFIATLTAAVRP